MTKPDDDSDPWQRLRPNHGDRLHDQQLQRDVQAINEQIARALGPLPPGGLPVQPKRKPQLPRPAVPPVTPDLPPSDEDTTMQWKSVAAVAALATGSTLAACGADGSQPPQVDPHATVSQDVPTRVDLPPVEALPPTASQSDATPAESADTVAAAPEHERGPAIPAAQLRRQILSLLASFQTLEDLERGNVERAFGVQLQRNLKMTEGYDYEAETKEGWNYSVSVDKLYGLDRPSTILIGLDHGVEPFTDQEPTYCTLEFESLAKELVAMGYERADEPYRFRGDKTWWFKRPTHPQGTSVAIGFGLYSTKNNQTDDICILSVRVGGNTDE